MGCEVQRTDTGTEIDVHRFDSLPAAQNYVIVGRRYSFTRQDSWGLDGNIYLYSGPNPGERAAIRRDGEASRKHGVEIWRASFWIEKAGLLPAILKLLPALDNAGLADLAEKAAEIHNSRVNKSGQSHAAHR